MQDTRPPTAFERDLEALINRHGIDNEMDTPDHVLARFLCNCLEAHGASLLSRDNWEGRPIVTAVDEALSEKDAPGATVEEVAREYAAGLLVTRAVIETMMPGVPQENLAETFLVRLASKGFVLQGTSDG